MATEADADDRGVEVGDPEAETDDPEVGWDDPEAETSDAEYFRNRVGELTTLSYSEVTWYSVGRRYIYVEYQH